MGVGRFVCVALPLILTGLSIVTLLYATLSGVSHENLDLFRLNTTGLSISPADAGNIADKVLGLRGGDLHLLGLRDAADLHLRDAADSSSSSPPAKTSNITAADLGLADLYDVTLWGFCSSDAHGAARVCSPHQFDWAAKQLSASNLTTAGGVPVQLPKSVRDALAAFRAVTRWAEVVFVAALLALGVQLAVGLFANLSRAVSCLVWLVSLVAAALVCAAAALATTLALIVVGAVDSTAKFYGVRASFDSRMLAVVWIAAAFAIAASLFWVLTVCCCKPEHHRSKRSRAANRASDAEKLLPTAFPASHRYAPIDEHQQGNVMSTAYVPDHNRSDLAYEPYSHRI
ncbi:hypothetical protein ESCO_000262 [Escovopsis weberi]|uniref:SUR7 family protein pun1 n=1 Tax=Escovopsis weberi TaxID=150374 RepID=A0A0M8MUQ6_ESCWE|nr:hypothetical protein ESCO_000262 [Escovopsis weberi]